jgi:predicted short-subunit dehydrogenase-like oxidoreductase (DUF2520 family)
VKVWILGRGKLGRALAFGLSQGGVDAQLSAARRTLRFAPARTRAFILAVPDAAIATLAERLASQLGPGDVVLHCAGSRGPDELRAARARGASTAAMHPLVSFASPRTLPELAGTSFVVSGDARAVRTARRLCASLGAHAVHAAVLGPAYHAAAALLANGSAALGFAAVEILCQLGLSRRTAERALGGLLASVAFNVRAIGVPAALTGPVARGDRQTVRRHLEALRGLGEEHAESYRRVQPLIERCADAQRAMATGKKGEERDRARARVRPRK